MSVIMVRCPNTKLIFSTGIETDRESFEKIPEVLGFAWCPHCQSEHGWWNDEGWLAEGSTTAQGSFPASGGEEGDQQLPKSEDQKAA